MLEFVFHCDGTLSRNTFTEDFVGKLFLSCLVNKIPLVVMIIFCPYKQ